MIMKTIEIDSILDKHNGEWVPHRQVAFEGRARKLKKQVDDLDMTEQRNALEALRVARSPRRRKGTSKDGKVIEDCARRILRLESNAFWYLKSSSDGKNV